MLASALRHPSWGTQAGPGHAAWGEQAAGDAVAGCWVGGVGAWGRRHCEVSGRAGLQDWGGHSGGQKEKATCVSVLLPQLYQCHPSLTPAPVLCLLARSIPVPSAACTYSESSISSFGGCFPFYHSPARANLLSGLGYSWTGIRAKPRVGSSPLSSHPHQVPVESVLKGDSIRGFSLLHGVPMPRACLPAAYPSGDLGAGLGAPAGIWEQGWVPQACRSWTRQHCTCCSSFPLHENVWLEA